MGLFNFGKKNDDENKAAETEVKDVVIDIDLEQKPATDETSDSSQMIIKLADLDIPEEQDRYIYDHAKKTISFDHGETAIRLQFGNFNKRINADEFFDEARELFADLPIDDLERYYIVDDEDKISQSLAFESIIGLINMMYSLTGVNTTHHKKETLDSFPDKKIKDDIARLKEALCLLCSGNYPDIEDILICGINDYRDHIDAYLKSIKDAILSDLKRITTDSDNA